MSLDTEVAEHGVGAPAPEKLDGIWIDVGAEEGGGPSRTQGATGDQRRRDPSFLFNKGGSMPKSIGDEPRRDIVPLLVVRIQVVMERGIRRGIGLL